MPHVRFSDMAPDVRLVGSLYRMVSPLFAGDFFRMDRLTERFLKGRWLSRWTSAETVGIPRPDGTRMRLLVCRSKKMKTRERATGVFWIHGGGYALGQPEVDFSFADLFCEDGSAVTVLPEYTRSTHAPYPAALMDCHLTLSWMRDHAEELGIDEDQIFVGGDSAGGGLTAALCLYERDEGGIPIAFQMPLYPMLDDREETESSRDNDAPVWN